MLLWLVTYMCPRHSQPALQLIYNTNRLADLIDAAAAAGLLTVDNMITTAQGLGQQLEPNPAECNVAEIASTTLGIAKASVDKSRITTHLTVESSVPKMILTDKAWVQRILLNIINNALKFTEVGSVTVNVASINGKVPIVYLMLHR